MTVEEVGGPCLDVTTSGLLHLVLVAVQFGFPIAMVSAFFDICGLEPWPQYATIYNFVHFLTSISAMFTRTLARRLGPTLAKSPSSVTSYAGICLVPLALPWRGRQA